MILDVFEKVFTLLNVMKKLMKKVLWVKFDISSTIRLISQ